MKRFLCGVLALALLVSVTGKAEAQYLFTTIDEPGSTFTTIAGINNLGQIVGDSSAGPYLRSRGNYTRLSFSPAGINDHGDVVGGNVLYSNGSSMTLSVGSGFTYAQGINNAGQVVGAYYDLTEFKAFLYSGGSYSIINFPGATTGTAQGINNIGQIVGASGSGDGWLLSGGIYSYLDGTPQPPQPPFPTGINDLSQIVGWVGTSQPEASFLLSDGIYTTLAVPGATMTEANGITNAGEIVGTYVDAGGRQHGFLATPTPAPSTLLLLGIATLGLIGWVWRRHSRTAFAN